MSEEKVPTLLELVKYYKEGILPNEKVFKYQSLSGVKHIHIDELQKEVVMSSIYTEVAKNRFVPGKTKK